MLSDLVTIDEESGTPYVPARELCKLAGYRWQRFEPLLISSAKRLEEMGVDFMSHFKKYYKKSRTGVGGIIQVDDYKLDGTALLFVLASFESTRPEALELQRELLSLCVPPVDAALARVAQETQETIS